MENIPITTLTLFNYIVELNRYITLKDCFCPVLNDMDFSCWIPPLL